MKKNKSIVKKYFVCWKTYDTQGLKNLFSRDARYEIMPIYKTLYGLEEIRLYWKKNRIRQRNIEISWDIKKSLPNEVWVDFSAEFIDVNENESQLVSGIILLIIDDNKKIYRLTELYTKKILGSN